MMRSERDEDETSLQHGRFNDDSFKICSFIPDSFSSSNYDNLFPCRRKRFHYSSVLICKVVVVNSD